MSLKPLLAWGQGWCGKPEESPVSLGLLREGQAAAETMTTFIHLGNIYQASVSDSELGTEMTII